MAIEIGEVRKTNLGLEYTILQGTGAGTFRIEFHKTGTIREASRSSIYSGEIRDYLHPCCCGVGCPGEPFDFFVPKYVRQKWRNMLRRCYDESVVNYKHYGGLGVTVSDDWLNFSNFAQWYLQNEPPVCDSTWHLDKDISGGSCYSSETCLIVPSKVNYFFREYQKVGTSLPKGVTVTGAGRFRSRYRGFTAGKEVAANFKKLEDALEWLFNNRDTLFLGYCRDLVHTGQLTPKAMVYIHQKIKELQDEEYLRYFGEGDSFDKS